MKATELMLGDWVNVGSYIDRAATIQQISGQSALTSIGGPFLCANLNPILITKEILYKNGFDRYEMYFRYDFDESQYVEYYPFEGRLERIYIHKDETEEVVGRLFAIKYVHELQRALHIYGIEKEIVL